MPRLGRPSPLFTGRIRRDRPQLRWVFVLGLAFIGSLSGPAAATRKASPRTHVVYQGQTLGMIAKRYNVTLEALRAANQLKVGQSIKPRQRLVIPGPDDPDGQKALEEAKTAAEPAGGSKAATRGPQKAEPRRDRKAPAPPEAQRASKKPPAKSAPAAKDYARKPKRRGFVSLVSFTGSFRGQVLGKDGKLTAAGAKAMSRVLASWRTGERSQIDENLVRLVVKVSDHFGGRMLRVVSGYRPFSPQQYTSHSRHNTGHAVDFSVDGVPNEVVRDYCRKLGKVGVGYYPRSSFVHLDVRETPTYWVDFSGPGEAPRYATGEGRDPATIPASHVVPSESPFMDPSER